MMPLTEALKMSFHAVVRGRAPEFRNDLDLTHYEISQIHKFLEDNCPAYVVSLEEIRLLFYSFQQKRTRKKKKNVGIQLSRYA